jgi:hypothetical protein
MSFKFKSRVTVGSRLLIRYQPTQNDGDEFDVTTATVVFYLRDPDGNVSTLTAVWNGSALEWQYRLAADDLDETSRTTLGIRTDWAIGVSATESPMATPSEWFPLHVYPAAGP